MKKTISILILFSFLSSAWVVNGEEPSYSKVLKKYHRHGEKYSWETLLRISTGMSFINPPSFERPMSGNTGSITNYPRKRSKLECNRPGKKRNGAMNFS
jgi:hypothetical protein